MTEVIIWERELISVQIAHRGRSKPLLLNNTLREEPNFVSEASKASSIWSKIRLPPRISEMALTADILFHVWIKAISSFLFTSGGSCSDGLWDCWSDCHAEPQWRGFSQSIHSARKKVHSQKSLAACFSLPSEQFASMAVHPVIQG